MFIIGFSYLHGHLLYGLVAVYALMALIFIGHIIAVKKELKNNIAVYGTITDYFIKDKGRHFYPVVKYTTEEGRDVTSTYSVQDNKKRYEIGSEEMVCYDPRDPMSFYFSGREDELTRDYQRFLIIGGIIALVLIVVASLT